jgi:hypothetical protein
VFFEVIVIGAYAGAACLVLLLSVLGRGVGALAPSLGAAQIVLVQASLAIGAVVSAVDGSQEIRATIPVAAVFGAELLLCATLAWLAHRLRLLRIAAAYAPLVLIALDIGLAALALKPDPAAVTGAAGVFPEAWVDLIFITAVIPAAGCFSLGKTLTEASATTVTLYSDLGSAALFILTQCLLICVFALLARNAVRRYRGGRP